MPAVPISHKAELLKDSIVAEHRAGRTIEQVAATFKVPPRDVRGLVFLAEREKQKT